MAAISIDRRNELREFLQLPMSAQGAIAGLTCHELAELLEGYVGSTFVQTVGVLTIVRLGDIVRMPETMRGLRIVELPGDPPSLVVDAGELVGPTLGARAPEIRLSNRWGGKGETDPFVSGILVAADELQGRGRV